MKLHSITGFRSLNILKNKTDKEQTLHIDVQCWTISPGCDEHGGGDSV